MTVIIAMVLKINTLFVMYIQIIMNAIWALIIVSKFASIILVAIHAAVIPDTI
jgi:hypothetical protein